MTIQPHYRRLRLLAASLVLLILAWVFAWPAQRPPLYDGIGFPDEPYRYVNPPPGTPATQPPTAAEDTEPASGGAAAPALVPASAETGPQVAAYIPVDTLTLPNDARRVTARFQPVAPAAPLPPDGTIWGNVYRLTITTAQGPAILNRADFDPPYLELRAPTAAQPGPVMEVLVDGTWHRLDTHRDGQDVYAASFNAIGDFALVTITPTASQPGNLSAPPTPQARTASTASGDSIKPTVVILAAMLVVLVAGIIGVRLTRRTPGDPPPPQ